MTQYTLFFNGHGDFLVSVPDSDGGYAEFTECSWIPMSIKEMESTLSTIVLHRSNPDPAGEGVSIQAPLHELAYLRDCSHRGVPPVALPYRYFTLTEVSVDSPADPQYLNIFTTALKHQWTEEIHEMLTVAALNGYVNIMSLRHGRVTYSVDNTHFLVVDVDGRQKLLAAVAGDEVDLKTSLESRVYWLCKLHHGINHNATWLDTEVPNYIVAPVAMNGQIGQHWQQVVPGVKDDFFHTVTVKHAFTLLQGKQ